MDDLIYIVLMGFVAAILWWGTPSNEEIAYWEDVLEQGRKFWATLKEADIAYEDIAALPCEARDDVLKSWDLDPEKIDDFVEWATTDASLEEFSEDVLIVWERAWPEYRASRQAIRRWPGYNSQWIGIKL